MKPKDVLIAVCLFAVLAANAGFAQDNWIGPNPGNWNNPANWSAGLPGPSADVVIYSGGNDWVILDPGTANINSLTLGGANNGTYSLLSDNGVAQKLAIAQSLTVGRTGDLQLYGGSTVMVGADSFNGGGIFIDNGNLQINASFENSLDVALFSSSGASSINIIGTLKNDVSGYISLQGNGDTANVGTLVNNGAVIIGAGASMNMNSGGITDLASVSYYDIEGKFTVGGVNSFFANLTSIEGDLDLGNGSITNITPNSGTLTNAGGFAIVNGTTVSLSGDVINGGFLATGTNIGGGYGAGGNNTLNISGTLVNSGAFEVYASGDVANVGTLVNDGFLFIGTGATLNVANQLNVTDIPSGATYRIFGTFNAGPNSAFVNLTSVEGVLFLGNGQTTNITPNGGTLYSSGYFDISGGSTVNIAGDVINKAFLSTAYFNSGGNNRLNISGTLTNNFEFVLNGDGDIANVGALNNNDYVYIGRGAILTRTNQLAVTDIPSHTSYEVYGNFNSGPNNAFASLTSVEGTLDLANGQMTNITPNVGTLTISKTGNFYIGDGTTVGVSGDVVNNNYLTTGYKGLGGNSTLNIAGTLINDGAFYLYSNGDVANIGTLANSGSILINSGATLNLTNQLSVTDIPSGAAYQIFGTFNAGPNSAFVNLTSVEGTLNLANGQTTNITPMGGTLTNAFLATLAIGNGSTLNINGDVVNRFNLTTGYYYSPGGNNTLNITGALINQSNGPGYTPGTFYLSGPGDVANIGTLINNGIVGIGGGSPGAVANIGTLVNNGSVGISTGSTVNVAYGFYQLAQGTLGEEIGASGFGILVTADGPLVLDGTLGIFLDQGFNPAIGTSYKFLLFQPGELSGTFASIENYSFNNGTELWYVIYDNADGYVELKAGPVPEPGSLLLLGSSLMIGAGMLRRKVMR